MKKIVWITGDYFIDVDLPIVPLLNKLYDIQWFVIKSLNTKIQVQDNKYLKQTICCKFRGKDPRIIIDYLKIINEIKLVSPDVVYIDYVGYPYFYPLVLLFLDRTKIIHAAHNVIPYDGWPNKKGLSLYLNFVFKCVRIAHLFSKHLIPYFETKYPKTKSFYIPLSLKDYGEGGEIKKTNEKVFLFFGNVKDNKRLDILINAFMRISDKKKRNARLIIAGKCDNPEYYKKIADDNNILFRFEHIPDEEVANIFLSSHYLVLPYENVAQSGPHMIAYNYMIPVICSNIDGFKERLEDGENGYLFKVNDIENLRSVLENCIEESDDHYRLIKENLSVFVPNNYSTAFILRLYAEMFNEILHEN
jgi:glycosyltransferase involved in cell wall biosynthesis